MFKILIAIIFTLIQHQSAQALPGQTEDTNQETTSVPTVRIAGQTFSEDELPRKALEFYLLMEDNSNAYFAVCVSGESADYFKLYNLGKKVYQQELASHRQRSAAGISEDQESILEQFAGSVGEFFSKKFNVLFPKESKPVTVDFYSKSIN